MNVKRRRYFPFLDAGEVHFLSFAAEEEQIIVIGAIEKSKGVDPAPVVQTENDAGGRDVVNAQTGSADDDSVIFAGGRPADQGTWERIVTNLNERKSIFWMFMENVWELNPTSRSNDQLSFSIS